MRVVQEDTDYRIFLTEEEIKSLLKRNKPPFPPYNPLTAKFTDNRGETKELEIICTTDPFILNDEKTHDNIFVDFDDLGPYVKVGILTLASLLDRRDYLVTRYNGESKILIHKDTERL